MFRQPEFNTINLVHNISDIIDNLDEIISKIFDDIKYEPKILIGSQSPFGNFFGTILTKYKIKNKISMFGVLGPIRMNYEKGVEIVKFVQEKISSFEKI